MKTLQNPPNLPPILMQQLLLWCKQARKIRKLRRKIRRRRRKTMTATWTTLKTIFEKQIKKNI